MEVLMTINSVLSILWGIAWKLGAMSFLGILITATFISTKEKEEKE